MYTPGKLIYFDPFFFKNDKGNKPKYFLVIKVVDDNVILASLPSSVIHLPKNQKISHGCLDIQDACINCYIFEANRPITKCGWSFQFDTMLYGCWLDDFSIQTLKDKYQIEHVDYEIIGELTEEELQSIISCFAHSSSVKRRYRRLLGG